MKPNQSQKTILKQWLGVYRWFYNRTIDVAEKEKIFNFRTIRTNYLRNEETREYDLPDWASDMKVCPRIITGAIKDCCSAYKSAFANLKNGNIQHFEMSVKNKKCPYQCLNIESTCFGQNNQFLPKYFKDILQCEDLKIKKKKRKQSIKFKNIKIESDCRINFNQNTNEWSLVIPIKQQLKESENQAPYSVCSLDPGVRTFMTGYCPDGHVKEFAFSEFGVQGEHIKRLKTNYLNQDLLISALTKLKNRRKKKKIKRLIEKNKQRRHNLINDLHFKTISDLTKNYKVLLLPNFETSKMVKGHKLEKITKRMMLGMQFYQFQQRLKDKCDVEGTVLHIVNESFTSVTCGKCGEINKKLGKNKNFKCSKCSLEIDRDINGSRNILLKNIKLLNGSYPHLRD